MSSTAADTIRWILDPARDDDDEHALIGGYVASLQAAGAELHRVGSSIRPLDPQVWVRNVRWEHGKTIVEERPRDTATLPDYIGSPAEAIHSGTKKIRERLDPANPTSSRFHTLHDFVRRGATDYAIYAIEASSAMRSFISYTSSRPGGFLDEEIALFEAVHPAMSMLVHLRALKMTTAAVLRTYLGPNAAERVLGGEVARGSGERISAAIWFCDLRDFTVLSDALPADELLHVLDHYFEVVAGPIVDGGGEILKFIGDAMLAIFPIGASGPADACRRALDAAIVALERFDAEVAHAVPGRTLAFGVSLHAGDVYYGNIGARGRLDFTVIGPAVNLAARVQGQCNSLGTPLLMSSAFAANVPRDDLRPLGGRTLKGIATPIEVVTIARFVK